MPSRTPTRTRLARTLALLVAFCVVVLGLGGPAAATDGATEKGQATAKVQVRIDPAASTLTTIGAGAEVVGTISNDSGSTIGDATVQVGVGGAVLDTSTALTSWLDGKSRLAPPVVAKTSVGAVADGATRQFRVKIPADKLPWKYQLAALPMTVTLTDGATVTPASTVSQTRTTLQMQNGAVTSPLKVGWVVPLTLPADPALFGPSGTARDDAWNKAIGRGSRVQQLLTALADQPVTWLVDPILLDPPVGADDNVPAAQINDPATNTDPAPTTSTPSSTTEPSSPSSSPSGSPSGTGSTSAPSSTTAPNSTAPSSTSSPSSPTSSTSTDGDSGSDVIPSDTVGQLTTELLTKLRSIGSNQRVWWTGYDDPDFTTLLARSPELLQRDLARPLAPALSAISTTRAVWPTGEVGAAETRRITAAWTKAGQQAPVMILPRRAVTASASAIGSSLRTVAGTGGTVLYNEALSKIATAGEDPGTAPSHVLAETIAAYQQAPGTDRSLSIVVPRDAAISPQTLAATVRTIRAAGWLADLDPAALSSAPAVNLLGTPEKGTAYPAPSPSALTPGLVDSLARQRERVNTIGSILVDGEDVVAARHRALDVIGSTRWRGHAAELRAVNRTSRAALTAMAGKVSVNPSTVNFFADSGRLAVTVVNDLNRAVHDVQLRLVPRRYLLRIEDQPAPVSMRANSRSSIRADVTAVSPGEVAIDARLFGPGEVPLGEPGVGTQLMVNVRPTSTWIYWALGIVGGLVLIVGLWRSLRNGPRRATVDPTSTDRTPADAIVATASPNTKAPAPDDEQS